MLISVFRCQGGGTDSVYTLLLRCACATLALTGKSECGIGTAWLQALLRRLAPLQAEFAVAADSLTDKQLKFARKALEEFGVMLQDFRNQNPVRLVC
jgi:hypothetical protein